jgi:CRISPR-associated protein Cas7/Csd2 subtype I-C
MSTKREPIINLPAGKDWQEPVAERHDIVMLFGARLCNPNGDPDAGNMPRIQPDSGRGLVTDVCLKRKVRNFFSLFDGDGNPLSAGTTAEGYDIFVRENAILQRAINDAYRFRSLVILKGALESLTKAGAMSEPSAAEIAKEFEAGVTRDPKEDGAIPDLKEPGKCAEAVLSLCAGRLNLGALASAVADRLKMESGFPPDVIKAIEKCETKPAESSADGMEIPATEGALAEAILKAAQEAYPVKAKKGDKAKFDKAIRAALKAASPQQALKEVLTTGLKQVVLEEATRAELCRRFIDIRSFGAVTSTKGPLFGSFYGQIRGPLQVTFAESLDRVMPLDLAITRCAVASEDEKKPEEGSGNRTMGRKFGIDYGLYRCHIHFSPAFAAKTGFSYNDLDNFFFAVTRMLGDYNVDIASARAGGMTLVGLVDFQHHSALGNAPAHKLFERVKVSGKKVEHEGKTLFSRGNGEYSEFPAGLHDYDGEAPEGDLYFNERDGRLTLGKNQEGASNISTRLLVWPEQWRPRPAV